MCLCVCVLATLCVAISWLSRFVAEISRLWGSKKGSGRRAGYLFWVKEFGVVRTDLCAIKERLDVNEHVSKDSLHDDQ